MTSVAENQTAGSTGGITPSAGSTSTTASALAGAHGGIGNLDVAGLAQDVAARQQQDPQGTARTVAELEGMMTPVQRGEFAAALDAANDNPVELRSAAGQTFEIGHPDAPAVADWGNQPVGGDYQKAWADTAARIGSDDPAAITAALETELYGAPSTPAAASQGPDPVQLGLDLTQMGLDIVGIFEPTFFADGTNAVISLGRSIGSAVSGDWGDAGGHLLNAGISTAGVLPYAGDTAKLGKIGKWAQTVADGVSAVAHNPALRETLEPGLRAVSDAVNQIPKEALDALPADAKAAIEGMKRQLDEFFAPAANTAADAGTRAADDAAAAVAKREQVVMDGGKKGDWSPELNARNLKPNTDYVVNGYVYKTDDAGRVTTVEGSLELKTADRNDYQQRISGREDRLADDQGGHLIASIFNGAGERVNLVPMNGNFNMGAWRTMEKTFADALEAGKKVDVNIDVIYNSASGRPDAFVVDYVIDGVAETKTFMNRAGG